MPDGTGVPSAEAFRVLLDSSMAFPRSSPPELIQSSLDDVIFFLLLVIEESVDS